MGFVAYAAIRDPIQIQNITIVQAASLAILNTNAGNPILRRIVHYARDQVPLCSSLQIPIDRTARLLGHFIGNKQHSGGRYGFLWHDLHSPTALGQSRAG